MSHLRHIYCGILISLCFLGVSTFKVAQDSIPIHGASGHPSLSLVSLSLDKWGSKAFSGHAEQPLNGVLSGESLLKLQSLSNQLGVSVGVRKASTTSSTVLIATLFLWCLIAIFLLAGPWGTVTGTSKIPPEPPAEASRPASSPILHEPIAYKPREYTGQEERAITLLLKCNIISKEELDSNSVSQEHLAECVLIATQMLQMRSFEEWVELSQYGRQSFQDTVAAIFEAREHARAAVSLAQENVSAQEAFAVDPPETQMPPYVPVSAASLQQGSRQSSPVFGPPRPFASPEFGHEHREPVKESSVPSSGPPPKPHKSPVPILNCYNQTSLLMPSSEENVSSLPSQTPQVDAEEQQSVSSQGDDEAGGFPSVFSSSRSPSELPQVSQRSTPGQVSQRSTLEPPDSSSPASRLVRLNSQEIMSAPPRGWNSMPAQDSQSQSQYQRPSTSLRLSAREVLSPAPESLVREPITTTTYQRAARPSGSVQTAPNLVSQD